MRIPLYRSGGDRTPIVWWEYLFTPFVLIVFIVFAIIGAFFFIPYYWLYPERHAQQIDLDGTSDERHKLEAFRIYRRRVSLWRRILEKARIVAYDSGRHDYFIRDQD